jgi:hypothetical protein
VFRHLPANYLGHLLGHEGEGSVFAFLKSKGWASGLVAGEGGDSFSAASTFFVKVELTEAGNEHTQEVLAVVFDYINLIRKVTCCALNPIILRLHQPHPQGNIRAHEHTSTRRRHWPSSSTTSTSSAR